MTDTNTTGSVNEVINSEVLDEVIVSSDKQFTIPITSTVGDETKTDNFIFKVPSAIDIIQIGVIESNHLAAAINPKEIPMDFQNLSFIIASLKVCLVSSPAWFDINTTDDVELLEDLYAKHLLVVENFRKKNRRVLR
jgi:CMP-N-acetylneuraminic acid synthetase